MSDKTKTKKLTAKAIRSGMVVSLSAPRAKVLTIQRLADLGPVANDNLLLITVEGTNGPLRGRKWKFTTYEADNLDVVLKNPALRRGWDWLWTKLMGAKP